MLKYRHEVIIGIIIALIGVSAVNKGYTMDDIDSLIPYIIQAESNGNANAYNSRSGAIGLMQITPIVLREYNERNHQEYLTCYEDGFLAQPIAYRKIDLYDSKVNKQVGIWYLRRLKSHYLKGAYTIPRLLASYNMGYAKLKRLHFQWWKIPETKHYVEKILKLYERR